MLEPQLSPAPGWAWRALFGVTAVWFAVRALSTRRRGLSRHSRRTGLAAHVLESAAMIYMLTPARTISTAQAAMPGMTAAAPANPVVTLLFTLLMVGYILWTADQLTTTVRGLTPDKSSAAGAATSEPWQCLLGYQKIVMSAAMSYMLVTML